MNLKSECELVKIDSKVKLKERMNEKKALYLVSK